MTRGPIVLETGEKLQSSTGANSRSYWLCAHKGFELLLTRIYTYIYMELSHAALHTPSGAHLVVHPGGPNLPPHPHPEVWNLDPVEWIGPLDQLHTPFE